MSYNLETYEGCIGLVNSLRARIEQTEGATSEQLAELASRGILPPSIEELQDGVRALHVIRAGAQPAMGRKPASEKPSIPLTLDDF